MGRFIARQPNGKLCEFSTVVDTVINWDMDELEYIELCAERARKEARRDLSDPDFIRPFSEVIESFRPNVETKKMFLAQIRWMGDNKTKLKDL